MQEIIDKLCDILLETPVAYINVKIVKQKVWEVEVDYYKKHRQISPQVMQSMKFDAERAEQNMLLKKG